VCTAACKSEFLKPREEEEEEDEAVFISVVNTNEDPPNAHQEEEEAVFISVCKGSLLFAR